MNYLLDINICIYAIKKRPYNVFEKLRSIPIGSVAISAITYAELEYGVEKSSQPQKNRVALLKFVAPFVIVPFTERAAESYGSLRAQLERAGQLIGSMDLLIGSQARAEKLTLVTNNVSEFMKIPDLKIENWVQKI
jgi:tRNA(fMet)-specific endonuclease VapC